MLENKYDWKISKADQNGNVYYYFPKDEDEFHTKSRGDKWTSSILNYLKTMSKDGESFYRYYKKCIFCYTKKMHFLKLILKLQRII